MSQIYLNSQEVKERFKIRSSVTLYNWRKTKGFPSPLYAGRLYRLADIERWEKAQQN